MSERTEVSPKPRLIIVTQWFPPEPAPFGVMMREMASFFAAAGWEVEVITGFPNHPEGVLHAGYTRAWHRRSSDGGFAVHRVWLSISEKRNLSGRALTFLSFTVTSAIRLLRNRRADVVFAVLQPLSQGLLLPVLCRLKGSRLVFNVQDLHPETQIRLGLIKSRWLIRLLGSVERFSYLMCDHVTAISAPFVRHVISKGVPPERATCIENWIDCERIRPLDRSASLRSAIGLGDTDFVILWAGTIGAVSGIETLISAASEIQHLDDVRFLVVGDGVKRASAEALVHERGLRNIMFRGFFPEAQLSALFASADIAVVTLAQGFGDTSVPSKILAYMAAGKPVVAAAPAESETAREVTASGAGIVVPPADGRAMSEAIRRLMDDGVARGRMGNDARARVSAHWDRAAVLSRYLRLFNSMVGEA